MCNGSQHYKGTRGNAQIEPAKFMAISFGVLSYNFYLMGQVCIRKEYRGKGLFSAMYREHKKRYRNKYEFLLTEIITSNKRSIKAHQKIGFKEIHSYHDSMGEWSLVYGTGNN
jgi:hypothetical protein